MPEINETAIVNSDKNNCEHEKQQTDNAEVALAKKEYNLAKFRLTRILSNNTGRKNIALLGTFPDVSESDPAIVLFEKQAFRESDVQTPTDEKRTDDLEDKLVDKEKPGNSSIFTDLKVQTEFINNIYGSYICEPVANLNSIKTTVVYPATEKHIEKHSIVQKFIVKETPTLYEKLTLPYITSAQFSLEWVYNILEHKQEEERIVFEDNDPETGFILLPDLKWDGKNVETLYLLAITHKRGIKSLRDLTADHLPLLRNIRTRASGVIEERYGVNSAQLRLYFHYQPSFYHLHVHINPVRNDAPGIWVEKSHMLDTVINNLELMPDYYQRATLPFVLYDGNKLLESFDEELHLRKAAKEPENAKEPFEDLIDGPPPCKRVKS